jgi:hypothetical protein
MAGLDPLSNILSLAGTVIDKIFPDKNEAIKQKTELARMAMDGQLEELKQIWTNATAQIQINVEEAKSEKWWKAGARPFVLWVCGTALAYHYIIQPFLAFTLGAFHMTVILPALDMGELMTLLFGMLGLGAMRSYDKTKKGENGNGKA